MNVDRCQRWLARCASFVAPSAHFDPSAHEVAAIADDTTARAFVRAHHYAGTYPAARFRLGLYEHGVLVGVAVFGVPVRPEVLHPFAPARATELSRFVLLDRVGFNGETWFLARCAEHLRALALDGFVMFSDPFARTALDGRTIFTGHVGGIYRAFNAPFLGRSHADTLHLLPDGRVFSRRALSKIRHRETGWRYAVEQLVAAGADPMRDDVDGWLVRELARVTRKVRHPGNLKYAFGLTRRARRALPASLPYLRLDDVRGSA